jgi:hypothetical protein
MFVRVFMLGVVRVCECVCDFGWVGGWVGVGLHTRARLLPACAGSNGAVGSAVRVGRAAVGIHALAAAEPHGGPRGRAARPAAVCVLRSARRRRSYLTHTHQFTHSLIFIRTTHAHGRCMSSLTRAPRPRPRVLLPVASVWSCSGAMAPIACPRRTRCLGTYGCARVRCAVCMQLPCLKFWCVGGLAVAGHGDTCVYRAHVLGQRTGAPHGAQRRVGACACARVSEWAFSAWVWPCVLCVFVCVWLCLCECAHACGMYLCISVCILV